MVERKFKQRNVFLGPPLGPKVERKKMVYPSGTLATISMRAPITFF